MNRRRFLRLVGSAATALAVAPQIVRAQTLGLGGGTAPSNRLNVGFIGGGGISHGHVNHVLHDSALQLLAFAEADADVLENNRKKISQHYAEATGVSNWNGLRVTKDFRDLTGAPDIDVIFNCTPDHWHALPVIYAARAGKHLYTEKPLSRTAEEGWAMVRAVEAAGVACQVGSQQRSSPEFIRAITLVRNGVLGKIKRVIVGLPSNGGVGYAVTSTAQTVPPALDYDLWVGPAPFLPYIAERNHFHWRWRYEFAGGQLTDWINHHFDIAQVALGVSDEIPERIADISGAFALPAIYNTASDYAFRAEYSGGRHIEVSSRNPMGVRFEGENGWVYVNRGVLQYSDRVLQSVTPAAQGYQVSGGSADHRTNFFNCIRNGTTTRSPIRQAQKTALVAHLVNAALRTGATEVRWDAQAERPLKAPAIERLLAANYRAPWHLPA